MTQRFLQNGRVSSPFIQQFFDISSIHSLGKYKLIQRFLLKHEDKPPTNTRGNEFETGRPRFNENKILSLQEDFTRERN